MGPFTQGRFQPRRPPPPPPHGATPQTKTELEEHLERLSREAAKDHALARKRARDNGYKKQLEILMAQQRSNANDHY